MLEKVQKVANDEFGSKAKNLRMPYKKDEETGEVLITAKSKYQPKFVDSTGQIIAEANVPNIFGGSVLKLSGNISTYDVGANKGVSLQLGHVQIIDLVEGSGLTRLERKKAASLRITRLPMTTTTSRKTRFNARLSIWP